MEKFDKQIHCKKYCYNVDPKRKAHSLKIKPNQDLNEWILELEEIKDVLEDLKKPIDYDDLVIYVMKSFRQNYAVENRIMQKEIELKTLNINAMIEQLHKAFQDLNKKKQNNEQIEDDHNSDDEENIALIASSSPRFKDYFDGCCKYGHKPAKCKTSLPKKNNNKRSNICKKEAILMVYALILAREAKKSADCWLKKKNDSANTTAETADSILMMHQNDLSKVIFCGECYDKNNSDEESSSANFDDKKVKSKEAFNYIDDNFINNFK